MAEILFHGQNGVHAQRNEAVDLFRAGAMQGDPSSMYNLGVLHLRVSTLTRWMIISSIKPFVDDINLRIITMFLEFF